MAEPHAYSQPIQTYGPAPHNRNIWPHNSRATVFCLRYWPILLFALVPPVYPLLRVYSDFCRIVNSIFLQRPQKRSRGNQFTYRPLSKTKIDRQLVRSSESGRQTVRRLWWWMVFGVETGKDVGRRC